MIIDLSCPVSIDHSPSTGVVTPKYGKLITWLMIHGTDLLDMGGRWDGCPNAGPEHKLRFHINTMDQLKDFRIMLDLIDETLNPEIYEINRIRMITRASNLFRHKIIRLSRLVKAWSI